MAIPCSWQIARMRLSVVEEEPTLVTSRVVVVGWVEGDVSWRWPNSNASRNPTSYDQMLQSTHELSPCFL
ncbi:MAG TPA: hypothetical protein VKF38_09230, partial [Anaerolineaceae bacterium]|nr:hypothetical protein [Anaerolineaceae bacterium]